MVIFNSKLLNYQRVTKLGNVATGKKSWNNQKAQLSSNQCIAG